MNKKIIIAASIVLGIIAIIVFFIACYCSLIGPVNKKDNSKMTFVIAGGTSIKQVINNLSDDGLIKNRYAAYAFVKIHKVNNIQAGEYTLTKSMNLKTILDKFSNGEANIKAVTIQFIEGKRLTRYVSDIANKFNYTEEEIMNVLKSEEFINKCINKYWFITADVKNKDLYYPLEGYLFADTYRVYENASIEDILFVMLDTMGKKLEPYKDQIKASGYSVHEILTLASIIEGEANNNEDRKMVSQVFYSRLKSGATLGSDVTTYYAEQKDLIQSLTVNELNACNAYNTRGTCVKGLPVGPIATPSLGSIEAALNPADTDYLYFIADKTGKAHFAKTSAEHLQNCALYLN